MGVMQQMCRREFSELCKLPQPITSFLRKINPGEASSFGQEKILILNDHISGQTTA